MPTLNIIVLNLMPNVIDTETQLTRMLMDNHLQVLINFTWIKISTFNPPDIYKAHMQKLYKTFDDIKDKYFDGMIITGTANEKIEFEDVKFWNEICNIMEWSKSHTSSTLHICWGAQAGMYYHFGIQRCILQNKIFGVYKHKIVSKDNLLVKDFDEQFYIPHSRYGDILEEDINKCKELELIVKSDVAGVCICSSKNGKQIFILGHLEYDKDRLDMEYKRDLELGLKIFPPINYYKNGDIDNDLYINWRKYGLLFYRNWMKYYC